MVLCGLGAAGCEDVVGGELGVDSSFRVALEEAGDLREFLVLGLVWLGFVGGAAVGLFS